MATGWSQNSSQNSRLKVNGGSQKTRSTRLTKCILLVLSLFGPLFNVGEVEARGGRGGGRGGRGGRIGRVSRGVSRSGGSVYNKPKSKLGKFAKSPWLKGALFAGVGAGAVYGLTSYQSRRRYYDRPGREPRVCRNFRSQNGTHYGYFICPQYHQPEDYEYCCGPETGQSCCRYWDDTGRAAGGIIGIIIGVAILISCVVCVCVCVKKRGKSGMTLSRPTPKATYSAANSGVNVTTAPDPAPPYGAQPAYPPAPGAAPYSGQAPAPYPGQAPAPYGAPAPYPAQSGAPMPYPAQAGGPMPYPAQAGGPMPYPAQLAGPTPYPAQPYGAGYPPGPAPPYSDA